MNGTANQSAAGYSAGRYCGSAARGVSKLTTENLREIEAHRSKPRPTPWAHLALRYGVNELDLRALLDPENDSPLLAKPTPSAPDPKAQRDARFRAMWTAGVPAASIMSSLGMSSQTMRNYRDRLGLPKRTAGRPKSSWNREIAA